MGPEDAAQRIAGLALDFCLLVTQRRHRHDLVISATRDDATYWLTIAQAFAGGAGGRQDRRAVRMTALPAGTFRKDRCP